MDELENLYHLFDSQKKDLLHMVQFRTKPLGPEEVHYFLTSMDKMCSHGLKNEKLGYWPFVQEFTHKTGVSYITDMKNATTGPGKGRAWLLLALSEGMLEFYFTTFVAHTAQRVRHYRDGAFLRDEKHLKQVVLGLAELMAAQFSVTLRPEEYDLDKHVCPPPNSSVEDGEYPSWAASPGWPPTEPEPLQWTHTGRRSRARHSRQSSSCSSQPSSRSSARSGRRRRSPGAEERSAGDGGRPGGEKESRRGSDTAPSDSACVTMESGESGRSDMSSAVTTPASESAESGESGESGEVLLPSDSATPTLAAVSAAISASSPLTLTEAPPPFSSSAEEVPSPVVAGGMSPSVSGEAGVAPWSPGCASPLPMSPLCDNPPPVGFGDGGHRAAVPDAPQSSENPHISQKDSVESKVSVSKDAPSGRCTAAEQVGSDSVLLTCSDAASADTHPASPGQDRSALSEDTSLSQPTSSKSSGTLSSMTSESYEHSANTTSNTTSNTTPNTTSTTSFEEPLHQQQAARRPSRADGAQSAAEATRLRGGALSPSAESRRVSSSDAQALEEALRRLKTDPPSGPGRPVSRPPSQPHLQPSASSVALRPRPAAARLPPSHSEVTLRRRVAPLPPDKRVTWAGTDRETAAVAALLPAGGPGGLPEPPRGERGAPEGQEDPARLWSVSSLTRVSSQLSVGSSCLSSASERTGGVRPAARQTRLYEPAALNAAPPPSDGCTERQIEQELSQGRRRKRAAYTSLVEIDHCRAVQLMVSFFDGDEMAYTGFKVLFGDHHAMRTCLLVLTSYRVLLLRLSTYRRLRRAARRRPRPADPLSQLPADAPEESSCCPYLQDAAFHYSSIASIKVAFHGQAVALQRPDGSYSRWIWLGDRAETALLISHVTRTFERSRLRPLVPQVYTSEAHRQQYIKEIRYRETEPEIQYASLVYFEDFAVPGETPKLSAQLMYKTDSDDRWSVGHFVLWDADLLVYPSAAALRGGGAPLDRWPLPAVTACRRLTALCRPHQLQLAAPGRCLTLAAPDADTCTRWAAVVREIMELSVPSQLPSPQPRCCVLTGRALYVVEEMAFNRSLTPGFELCPYGHLVQASGPLRSLEAVNADSHGTVHLEFDTAEAAESMGSWRLYFITLTEQRAFLATLLQTYRKHSQVDLTVGQISHHMREVCLSGSRYVRSRWDGLLDA